MLFIEIAKIEFTGGHIKIMLIIDTTKIKLTGGHIKIEQLFRHTRKKVSGPPFNNTTSRPQQRPIKTTRKHTTTHN